MVHRARQHRSGSRTINRPPSLRSAAGCWCARKSRSGGEGGDLYAALPAKLCAMLTGVGEAGKTWDERRAWSITEKFEAYYREHVPAGWRATPEEDRKIDALVRRRSLAGRTFDMEAWERAHYDLLNFCLDSWKRFQAERAPNPKPKSKPPKKKAG